MSDNYGKRPPLVADRRYPPKSARPARAQPTPKPKAKAKRTARPRRQFKNPLVGFVVGTLMLGLRVVWGVGWRLAAIVFLVIGAAAGYYASQMPPVAELIDARARGSVTLLDRDGKVFAWRGEQFGGLITPDTASPHLVNAVIATEDKRFYWHFGISPRGIASAIRINLREGRGPFSGNGGSTLTQQTAKLLCLGVAFDPQVWESEGAYESDCRESSLWRKAKEAVFALGMEIRYTKDEILTLYLNRTYMGAGSRGFEAAAQRYFGKSAAELTPAEGAMLAGLLVAPSYYSPTRNLTRAQDRANVVIGLMEDQDYLTKAEADRARTAPAVLSSAAGADLGGYFADWVMASGPEFLTRDTTEDVIIRTTLDQRMQRAAEDALAFVFETKVREGSEAQAAVVVMSADGAVRAMVGGRETQGSGTFNRATQALRQTGSSFKPFIYAAALELGYGPYDTVVDEPYCINVPGSARWCPENYSRDHRGQVTLTQALMHSLNVPAVKVSESVGRDIVRSVAEKFGVVSELAVGPALALGSSESTLIEMTGAYAGILNGGSAVSPYGLIELRFQGDSDPLMGATGGLRERVISEDAALLLTFMMAKVIEEGTGGRARLPDRQAAGKTGTTSALRDAWFIGFTADYVVGVWMGNDDNKPLTGVTGGGLPAQIWREVMVRINEGLPIRPLPMRIPEPPPPVDDGLFGNSDQGGDADVVESILLDLLNEIINDR